MADILSRLKLRRDSSANAASQNPTLADGEAMFARDTNVLKVGDGVTAWNVMRAFLSVPVTTIATAQAWLNAADAAAQRALLGLTSSATADTVGQIAYFALTSAPSGFLKSNGAAISRTTFAALFAKIGTTFGSGDGVTTFNLPDGRGEFTRGLDDGRGVDVGRVMGSFQAAAMLDHTHSGTTSSQADHAHGYQGQILFGNGTQTGTALAAGGGTNLYQGNSTAPAGAHSHTVTIGNPSVGGGPETRPRNIAWLCCIKY